MSRKKGLFGRLALTGIKNNYKLYVPYILAAIGMTAMFYIIFAISRSEVLMSIKGADTGVVVLQLGTFVVGLFAVIFMFYTNSFLIRTRTKEFGMYNILGMSRTHIARIVAIETIIVAGTSIIGGLIVGILFEKLAELLFAKMIDVSVGYSWSIDIMACLVTAAVFFMIFLLVMFRSVFRVCRFNTIDLLKSENYGEKPPKAKWMLTLLGILMLGFAYYLAIVMAAPVTAIVTFFFAVILVIIATYLLFISGSVSLCRGLQKNKKYYYKSNHFVPLSSMIYRMKRNGAGLASICILSTMVLVMISSTSCLYFGNESSLRAMYPNDIELDFRFEEGVGQDEIDETKQAVKDYVLDAVKNRGIEISRCNEFSYERVSCSLSEGKMMDDFVRADALFEDSNECSVYFVKLSDYNSYMGENRELAEDEVICCTYRDKYKQDFVITESGERLKIVDRTSNFFQFGGVVSATGSAFTFVVNDTVHLSDMEFSHWYYGIEMEISDSETINVYNELCDGISERFMVEIDTPESAVIDWYEIECRAENKMEFYAMFGGLFFLGIALSFVFICALVLIIYYKQISEGYEDASRYEIMRKVGMSAEDIKKNVNSQMGSVFYLPFVAAVIHLGFAFPMIYNMLKLFSVTELSSLLLTAAISVFVFGIIYTIVYKITSNSYYKIVK